MGIEELIIAMAEDRGFKRGLKRVEKKYLAEKKQIARNFKKDGFANDFIAKNMGLPLEVIESL